MPMQPHEIITMIKRALPDAVVKIQDLRGDGDHYAAHVVSKEFAGKTRVQQHQMVYAALQEKMQGSQGGLHALSLTTSSH